MIIRKISDSNLETGRNGSKSRVSQIIQESWHPWYNHFMGVKNKF